MVERLPILPDQDVIDTFNPLEYLLDGNKGIAEIPGHPDFLLRWWPRIRIEDSCDTITGGEIWAFTQASVLENHVASAEIEFSKLRALGISTLESGLDMVQFIDDAARVALQGVVQYSIVRRYRGSPLESSDPDGETLVEKYIEYLEQAGMDDLILYDAPKPWQHVKLNPPNGDSIILVDSEPVIARAGQQLDFKSTALGKAGGCLQDWAKNAQVSEPLNRRLSKLVLRAQEVQLY